MNEFGPISSIQRPLEQNFLVVPGQDDAPRCSDRTQSAPHKHSRLALRWDPDRADIFQVALHQRDWRWTSEAGTDKQTTARAAQCAQRV